MRIENVHEYVASKQPQADTLPVPVLYMVQTQSTIQWTDDMQELWEILNLTADNYKEVRKEIIRELGIFNYADLSKGYGTEVIVKMYVR